MSDLNGTHPDHITNEPGFPAGPPEPVPTQIRVTGIPTPNGTVIELATATPVGVHVVFLDGAVARRVADMIYEQTTGLVLPGAI